jgi:hypothetical protein
MLTRRIAASACALCLVVPATAAARPAGHPPTTHPNRVVHVDARNDRAPSDAYSQLRRANALNDDGTPRDDSGIDRGATGWRSAAVAEGTLLALLSLGSVLVVRSRRNVHHIGP